MNLLNMKKTMVRKTEEAVVCALLVEENGVVEVAPWLTAEMFYTPELGFISVNSFFEVL
jgi:hypothetical protein